MAPLDSIRKEPPGTLPETDCEQQMHIYSKDTQIEIAIAKSKCIPGSLISNTNSNNSNKLISDSAMDTLSTLNEKRFQGHTTQNSYISNKIQTFRETAGTLPGAIVQGRIVTGLRRARGRKGA